MARVVVFARNKICIDLVSSLSAHNHEVAAVFSAKAAPEYVVTKDQIQEYCSQVKIPFYSILDRQKIQNILEKKQPDVGLTANFPLVFDKQVICNFKYGIINAHGGDLPRYRGNACQAWAILNGEKEIALCAHQIIADEVDCGRILKKLYLPITSSTRVGEAINWIVEESCDLLLQAMDIVLDTANDLSQLPTSEPNEGFRCYPRNPADGRVNWGSEFLYLIRLVNASSEPYQGAFCFFQDQKLIIWRAAAYNAGYDYQAVPGQILEIQSDGLVVAAKNGAIKITDAQLDGMRGCPSKMINSIRERLT